MAPSKRLLLTLLSLAVGVLAVYVLTHVHADSQSIPANLNEKVLDNREVSEETTMLSADDTNKSSVSVYQCLQLKTELDPFNLLMALNQSKYSVADFTALNIDEIRECLNFLEVFQQRVSQNT